MSVGPNTHSQGIWKTRVRHTSGGRLVWFMRRINHVFHFAVIIQEVMDLANVEQNTSKKDIALEPILEA